MDRRSFIKRVGILAGLAILSPLKIFGLLKTEPDGIFNPFWISLKPDGTKMYIVGWLDNTVYQYTLSTPWDVTSASLTTTFSTSVLPARNFY